VEEEVFLDIYERMGEGGLKMYEEEGREAPKPRYALSLST